MIENIRETLVDIADKYCQVYGINRYDLFQHNKHKGGKIKKVINTINVSTLRMALGYYFVKNYPITYTEVAKLIGYKDHSTICYNNKKIFFYIKNNDDKFMKYYAVLVEIANMYPSIGMKRINKNQILIIK